MIAWIRAKIKKRRDSRQAKAHAEWMVHFEQEYQIGGSLAFTTCMSRAQAMARGMVMRHYDDRGIARCFFCVSTDQLTRRDVRLPSGHRRRYYVCRDHEGVNIQEPPKAKVPDELKTPDSELPIPVKTPIGSTDAK